jgi:hypothetical protein
VALQGLHRLLVVLMPLMKLIGRRFPLRNLAPELMPDRRAGVGNQRYQQSQSRRAFHDSHQRAQGSGEAAPSRPAPGQDRQNSQ